MDLAALAARKNIFLFGARGTGKTTLLKAQLPDAQYYDLLDSDVFGRLARRPRLLGEETSRKSVVVIDEVQKLPSLLDEVHRLIESTGQRFVLTGSSARKLRRSSANLLAGRAWQASLFPLVSAEIPNLDLETYLNRGGLPAIYPSTDYSEDLDAYANLYLREEIQAESLVRRVDAFARFLDTVALSNGEELNFQSIASDAGVPHRTVQSFCEILEDTLLGFRVAPFLLTKKRKPITRAKLFLFDIGVTNALAQRGKIRIKSELFGKAFEHLIALELRAQLSYLRSNSRLQYWRSTSGFEVDFVVGQEMAIEVKASTLVTERDLKGLKALREEGLVKRYVIVSLDPKPRTVDGIQVVPWRAFLERLWTGKFVSGR